MNSITIQQIRVEKNGHKISYDYEISSDIKKYFNKKFFIEYDIDISEVSKSILVIPLIANLLPISWFVGFDIILDELDYEFHQCISDIKEVFANEFPRILQNKSDLICANLRTNHNTTEKSAMLFSGGVDAYATYFRNFNINLDLILINGAEIPLNDEIQWNRAKQSIEDEKVLNSNSKHYIAMNCRDFYTYKVTELVEGGGWWGKIQHGLSLICATAPLSYKLGYGNVKIASSYTRDFLIFWGSMPEIDENIKWANTIVQHDSYDLDRTEKIKLISDFLKNSNEKINLRVCYSEANNGLNCNKCEKCYRTILGLCIENVDPNEFGFRCDNRLYKDINTFLKNDGFTSKGSRYFWYKNYEKLLSKEFIYSFNESIDSRDKQFLEKTLHNILENPIKNSNDNVSNFKRQIIGKYPRFFKFYMTIRGRFR